MKGKRTFKYCEYCNKAWEDVNPPTKEFYESGLIELDGASIIFLPESARKDINSCVKYLSGIYCNSTCLFKHLTKILNRK